MIVEKYHNQLTRLETQMELLAEEILRVELSSPNKALTLLNMRNQMDNLRAKYEGVMAIVITMEAC